MKIISNEKSKKAFSILIYCLLFNTSKAQLNFNNAINFGAGTNPSSLCSADFNLDGNFDLAVTNVNGGNLSILLGTAVGTFSGAVNYTTGLSPYAVASADFNGDTFPDIVTANNIGSTNNVSVLFGSGTGTFASAVNYSIGSSTTKCVTTGDFNNDGDMDLALGNSTSGGLVFIMLGSPTGTFSSAVSYPCGLNPYSIVSADLNNDGILDLATANYGGNNVTVLVGVGNGTFTYLANYAVGFSPISLTCNDFNADGNKDLAVANSGGNNLSVLLGNGTGSFATAVNFPAGNLPTEIVSADFDGDGNLDLATSNNSSNNVSILLGNGSAGFAAAVNFGVSSGPQALIVNDFNSDSKPDIVTANYLGNNVTLRLNTTTPLGANNIELNPEKLVESYPNPTTGILNIQLNSSLSSEISGITVEILNALGQKVLTEKPSSLYFKINLSDYDEGFYYLKLIANKKSEVIKFMKN